MCLSRRKGMGCHEKGQKLISEQRGDVRALVTEKRPEHVGAEASGSVYMGGGEGIYSSYFRLHLVFTVI